MYLGVFQSEALAVTNKKFSCFPMLYKSSIEVYERKMYHNVF